MACPVCFNAAASDETVRASLNLGIAVLLGVTACVLAGFLRFIVSIARRSMADRVEPDHVEADPVEANPVDPVEAGLQTRLGTEAT